MNKQRKFKLRYDLVRCRAGSIFVTTIAGDEIFNLVPDDDYDTIRYKFTIKDATDSTFFEEIFDNIDCHIDRLVKLAARNLQFDAESMGIGCIYLDPKRPFGFSGRDTIINQILEEIGFEPTVLNNSYGMLTYDYTEDEQAYALDLFQKHLMPAMVKKLLA